MSGDDAGLGMIHELARLQRAENERRAAMTPEERAADAVAQLRYIASVEPDSYGYLFEDSDS